MFIAAPKPSAVMHAPKSWPLNDQHRHLDLAHILNCAITDTIAPAGSGELSVHHAGLWECDLASGDLIWSGGVYDLFGLERGQKVTRERALSLYAQESRAILELVRRDAIRLGQGFTVDVKICPEGVADPRWVRIIAAPVVELGTVKQLHGVKLLL
jgi:hypothetical protein